MEKEFEKKLEIFCRDRWLYMTEEEIEELKKDAQRRKIKIDNQNGKT